MRATSHVIKAADGELLRITTSVDGQGRLTLTVTEPVYDLTIAPVLLTGTFVRPAAT